MKRTLIAACVLVLVGSAFAQDLSKATSTEIVQELFDVTPGQLGEALLALGFHQGLRDSDGITPRPATVDEFVQELRGRVNAWVLKRKEANRDTTTSVWSLQVK